MFHETIVVYTPGREMTRKNKVTPLFLSYTVKFHVIWTFEQGVLILIKWPFKNWNSFIFLMFHFFCNPTGTLKIDRAMLIR